MPKTVTPRDVAELLIDIHAVTVAPEKPFRWASGLLAPLYTDNRLIISDVVARKVICNGFRQLFERKGWNPNVVAGTATAGIPHAAWLAWELDLPMVYVRSTPKAHGKARAIEGRLPSPGHAVIIEDLISTGGSSTRAAAHVRNHAEVLGVAAIFQYGLPRARENFQAMQLSFETLTDLPRVLEVLQHRQLLERAQLTSLESWIQDPQKWSDAREPIPGQGSMRK